MTHTESCRNSYCSPLEARQAPLSDKLPSVDLERSDLWGKELDCWQQCYEVHCSRKCSVRPVLSDLVIINAAKTRVSKLLYN